MQTSKQQKNDSNGDKAEYVLHELRSEIIQYMSTSTKKRNYNMFGEVSTFYDISDQNMG